jgi:hypothetical protein
MKRGGANECKCCAKEVNSGVKCEMLDWWREFDENRLVVDGRSSI